MKRINEALSVRAVLAPQSVAASTEKTSAYVDLSGVEEVPARRVRCGGVRCYRGCRWPVAAGWKRLDPGGVRWPSRRN